MDIVARLRSGYHNLEQEIIGGLTHDGRCLEAADEIERLRSALAAEREACAKVADEHDYGPIPHGIGDLIRARSTPDATR